MAVASPNMSYPKPRNVQTKAFAVARADSSTTKCVLPKDAVITNVRVLQTSDAVTGAGAFSVGWSGATTAVLNAFAMATTKVGLAIAGTAIGTVAGAGTKLDSDKVVICSYTVGASTSGGVGYVFIDYFLAGPGENIDD